MLNKTEELIREHTHAGPVAEPLPLYPINRNLADVIEHDQIPERVKVINLHRSVVTHIQEHGEEHPYLHSIGEEVEQVIEQLRQNQISAQSALDTITGKVQRIVETEEEHAASSLDNLAFAVRMTLKATTTLVQLEDPEVDGLAQRLATYLQEHAGWPYSKDLQQAVRMQLYRLLLPHMAKPVQPNVVAALVNNVLKMHKLIL